MKRSPFSFGKKSIAIMLTMIMALALCIPIGAMANTRDEGSASGKADITPAAIETKDKAPEALTPPQDTEVKPADGEESAGEPQSAGELPVPEAAERPTPAATELPAPETAELPASAEEGLPVLPEEASQTDPDIVNGMVTASEEKAGKSGIIPLEAQTTDIYVTADGDDENDGTIDAPLATLTKAFEQAASGEPVTVTVSGNVPASAVATTKLNQEITLKGTGSLVRTTSYADGYLINVSPNSKLVIESVTIDGNKAIVDATQASVCVRGEFEFKSGVIKDNKNVNSFGGAITVIGDSANCVISGGTITGNSASFGGAVYYGSGSLVVKGQPGVGTGDADNGIYLATGKTLSVQSALTSGSRVNIEGAAGLIDKGTLATETGGGNATSATASDIHWCTRAYAVAAGSGTNYVLAAKETDWYVDGVSGSDNGSGAVDSPIKTLDALIQAAPRGPDVDVTVHVKADTTISRPINVTNFKSLTLQKWSGAGGEVKVLRLNTEANKGSMFNVYVNNELTVQGVTLDGNGGVITGTGSVVMVEGTFTLDGGKITNNKSANYGGGVFLSSGVFNMTGGEISGNTAGSGFKGGAVYYFDGTMNISGAPKIGAEAPGDGIWLSSGKIVNLLGDLGNPALDDDALVCFEGAEDAALGLPVVRKDGGAVISAKESDKIILCDRTYAVRPSTRAGADADYDLSLAEYYVAGADGTHHGLDTNPGTRTKPFATLAKAFAVASTVNPTNVFVMDEVPVADTALLDGKTVNLKKWSSAAEGTAILKRQAGFTEAIISIRSAAYLTMSDIIIDGANVAADAPAVYMGGEGLYSASVFTMNSGKIINNNNVSGDGGGIGFAGTNYYFSHHNFVMNGGEISGNKAAGSGGGVAAEQLANITITGGVIKDNTAILRGGGIAHESPTLANTGFLDILGGVITGNTAAQGLGIWTSASAARIKIGGDAQIGTTDTDNGIRVVYDPSVHALYTNAITLQGDMAAGAHINIEYMFNNFGGRTVVSKAGGSAISQAEADKLHWQDTSPAFNIVPRPADAKEGEGTANDYVLNPRQFSDFYVRANGDDNGPGTVTQPFKTLEKAFGVSSNLQTTNIHVMSDLVLTAQAPVARYHNIILKSYDTPGTPYVVRRAATGSGDAADNTGVMFPVSQGGALEINGLVIDGNKANVAGGSVVTLATETSSIKLVDSVIQNNKTAGNGGAILVAFGYSWSATNRQAVIIDSTIQNNEAANGGAIYNASGTDGGLPPMVDLTNATIQNNSATIAGGGIYAGAGNSIISLSSSPSGQTTFTGNTAANGAAIYLGDNATLNIEDAKLQIGTSPTDNGVYMSKASPSFSLKTDLVAGARINIEYWDEHEYGKVVIQKSAPATAQNDETYMHYQRPLFQIKRDTANNANYILTDSKNAYYVSPTGDDVTGNGTAGNPLKSVWHAVNATQPGNPSTIYIMDDLGGSGAGAGADFSHAVVIPAGKDVTLSNYNAGSPVIYRSATLDVGSMFTVQGGGILRMGGTGSGVTLNGSAVPVFNDVDWNPFAVIRIAEPTVSATASQVFFENGKITNYRGKAVCVEGHYWESNDRRSIFNMSGGEISGTSTSEGTAVWFGNNANAVVNLSGAPHIGAPGNTNDSGILFANATQRVNITSDLTAGASVNFNVASLANNRIVAKNTSALSNTATAAEALYFHSASFAFAVNTDTSAYEDNTTYVAKATQFDFYVAAPSPGIYGGSDTTGTGQQSAPFASITKAMQAMPQGAGQPITIRVMDDIDDVAYATVLANCDVVIRSWHEPAATPDEPAHTITAATGMPETSLGMIQVAAGSSLTLEDIIFDGNKGVGNFAPFIKTTSGHITLGDGAVLTNAANAMNNWSVAGAVHILGTEANRGTLVMNPGAEIIQNEIAWAGMAWVSGGVVMDSYSDFTMNGGIISENTSVVDWSSHGGNVAVGQNATFVMKSGSITGGASPGGTGGGVFNAGTFTMLDGEISGNICYDVAYSISNPNYAIPAGGALYNTGTANISGGKIIDNTGNAIYHKSGALNISGNTQIGANDTDNGVYLAAGQKITIPDDLAVTARINFAGKEGIAPGALVAECTGSALSADALAHFHNQVFATSIVQNPGDATQLIINFNPIYVASAGGAYSGNDANPGTVDAPLASFAFVADKLVALPPYTYDIYIMDRVVLDAPIIVNPKNHLDKNVNLNFRTWAGAAQDAAIVRGSVMEGAMLTVTGATTNLINIVFDGNGGAAGVRTDPIILTRAYFGGDYPTIINMYEGSAIQNNSTPVGGYSTDGSGLYLENTTLNLYGGKISNNGAADHYGQGGIFATGAILNISGGEISDNKAAGPGYYVNPDSVGGIFVRNTIVNITGGEIKGNSGGTGAIYIENNGDANRGVSISGGEISGNTGGNSVGLPNAGGIYVNYSLPHVNITGGEIKNNTAGINGAGGIYIANELWNNGANTVNISGGTITGNTADKSSGIAAGGVLLFGPNGALNVTDRARIGVDGSDNGVMMVNADAASIIRQIEDLSPDARINLEGKTGAAVGSIVASKRNNAGSPGVMATNFESGLYNWKDMNYRVVPNGDNNYKLVNVSLIYVSATAGSDTTGDGSAGRPYKTIEKAFAMAAYDPGIMRYTDIYLMDTEAIVMNAGVTVKADQNIVLRRVEGDNTPISIKRGDGVLDTLFTVEEGSVFLIRDVQISGSEDKANDANATVKVFGDFSTDHVNMSGMHGVNTAAVELSGDAAIFNMSNTTISGNTSKNGSGAVRADKGVFNFISGEISGNISKEGFAAILVSSDASLNIGAGKVLYNTGGYGVLVASGGQITVDGEAQIGASKTDNGVYLGDDVLIKLTGDLANNTRINIAGKQGFTWHTEVAQKTGGAPVNATEAALIYFQPGIYGVEPKTGPNDVYWLGGLEVAFLTAYANGTAHVETSTELTLVFDEYIGGNITNTYFELTPGAGAASVSASGPAVYYGNAIPSEGVILYYYKMLVEGIWDEGATLDIKVNDIVTPSEDTRFDPNTVTGVVLHKDTRHAVSLVSAVANGVANEVTSTKLTITLSEKIEGLDASYLIIDGAAAGKTAKAALTFITGSAVSEAVYELAVSGSWDEGESVDVQLKTPVNTDGLYTVYKVDGKDQESDVVLHRYVIPGPWTVTFRDHDGTQISAQQVVHGGAATAPQDPAHAGWAFNGWDSAFSNVTNHLTVTAQCTQIWYTVNFVDWNGSALKTEQVLHGGDATAPADPSRAGYTFTGWDRDYHGVTQNITVTAQYLKNAAESFVVTFVDWNGTTIKTQRVNKGGDAAAPANPTRSGYTFTGWDKSFKNVAQDITVTAQYKKKAPEPPEPPTPPVPNDPDPPAPPASDNAVAEVTIGDPEDENSGPEEITDEPEEITGVDLDEEDIIASEPEEPEAPAPEQQRTMQQETVTEAEREGIPVLPIGNDGVPLYAPEGVDCWALLDLLLSAIAVIYAVILLIVAIRRRKEIGQGGTTRDGFDQDDTKQYEGKRKFRIGFLAGSIAAAIISAVLFLLTQDMSLSMALLDNLTIFFALLLAAEFVLGRFVYGNKPAAR